MPLKCPTIDEGEIYIIREEDFRTKALGDYVKLGKTTRDTAKRLKEHQTGNPRKENAKVVVFTKLMSSLEKYIHYTYAHECVNSEWFTLTPAQVKKDVTPLINKLAKEHAAVRPDFDTWKVQSTTVSNGSVLPANSAAKQLHKEFLKQAEKYLIAEANMNILSYNLKSMVGTHDGIEDMIYLQRTTPFDKAKFLAGLTPAQQASCHKQKTTIGPANPTVVGYGGLLKKKHNKLYTDLKNSEKNYAAVKITDANLAGKPLKMNKTIQNAHLDYLKSKKSYKEEEWELQKIIAKLVALLQDNDEIDGIMKWQRKSKTSDSFDKAEAKKSFPAEYAKSEGPVDSKLFRPNIDVGRKY